jgi:MFS family permease
MNNKLDGFRSKNKELGEDAVCEYTGRRLRTFESFKIPVYRLYYYSMGGHWAPMQMQMVTRTLLIYRISGSGTILGLMSLAHAVPMLILSLYGGVIADRVEKRMVLIVGQMASAVVTLGVALTLTFNYLSEDIPGSWWILIVSSVMQGTIMGLMMPSRASILPEIVGEEKLMNAISLNNLGMNIFRIIAPASAGFLIAGFDFAVVYYLMTFLYMFATVFLLIMPGTRPVAIQGRSTMTEVLDGLRYIRGEATIMLILSFTLCCTILGMPFNILLPMFTEKILDVGSTGMGILLAVSGVGAIMVSLVLASTPNRKRGIMMLFSGLILSLALIGFSFSAEWYLSLFLAIFIGLGQTGQLAVGSALAQYYVDPTYRGRVMSIQMLGFGLSSLGTVFGGIMAESMGIEWSLGGLAMALTAVCLAMLAFSSRLRKLD